MAGAVAEASVRFGNGGSGSFVSANGLILAHHHVGSGMIEKLSTPERDLLREASGAGDELPCPDLELNVLMSVEDVNLRVNSPVGSAYSPEEPEVARRAVRAEIEKESLDETGACP